MMTVDQMIEVLTAYKAGKKIQFYHVCGWMDCNNPAFDFISTKYRVKPESVFPCRLEILDGPEKGVIYENVEHRNLPLGVGFRILPSKKEPKVIWVNEYADGSGIGYTSEASAKAFLGNHHKRAAVRYVESPEE